MKRRTRGIPFVAMTLAVAAASCSPEPVKAPRGMDKAPNAAPSAPSDRQTAKAPAATAGAGPSITLIGRDVSSDVYDHDVGEYRRTQPTGVLQVTRAGDGFRVKLHGEAPDRGDATAAPCTLVGQAVSIEGVMVAKLVGYEEDDYVVTDADAASAVGVIVIAQEGVGRVRVVERYSDNVCGVGSDLDGVYVSTEQ